MSLFFSSSLLAALCSEWRGDGSKNGPKPQSTRDVCIEPNHGDRRVVDIRGLRARRVRRTWKEDNVSGFAHPTGASATTTGGRTGAREAPAAVVPWHPTDALKNAKPPPRELRLRRSAPRRNARRPSTRRRSSQSGTRGRPAGELWFYPTIGDCGRRPVGTARPACQ
jgi:hypothetical protein